MFCFGHVHLTCHEKTYLLKGLCRCHTQRRIGGLGPRESFFGYDTDYKILRYCLHMLYSRVGVIPKEGLAGLYDNDKDLKVSFLVARIIYSFKLSWLFSVRDSASVTGKTSNAPSTSRQHTSFVIPKLGGRGRERRPSGDSSIMPYDSISQMADLPDSPPRSGSPDISDEETEEGRAERAERLRAMG